MKKRNKKKTGLIAIMLILVMLISIGYASISTNLTIGGNATITAQNWLIYFDHIQTTTGSVTPTTAPTTSGTSTTTLTWAVSLDTPGQFYEYTVDVVNAGSIDAMIGTLSNSTLTTAQAKYLNYTVTYSDGAEIEQYDKLDAGTTEKLRVRVEFKLDPEELPATASAITLNYASNYIQADTTHAKARNTVTPPAQPVSLEIGDSVSYSTTLNGQTLANWKVFYNDTTNGKVYLIYGDYLPNDAIPESSFSKTEVYEGMLTSNEYADDVIADLTNKTTFSSLLTGTLTIGGENKNISYTSGDDIWAIGTPDIELFARSWNAKYSASAPIYIEYSNTEIEDPSDYYRAGYFIGTSANPKNSRSVKADVSGSSGYNDSLYFLNKGNEDPYGYWLCSPHVNNTDYLVNVQKEGVLGANTLDLGNAIRPVICLPATAFE